MNIGIISQARMTSTRLPAKVLLSVKGKTMLDYHVERLKTSGYQVFIATTTNATDDVLIDFCNKNDIPYHRGSEDNVLSRYYETACKYNLDVIVRVTSDCPLIDGAMVGKAIAEYVENFQPYLYASNGVQRSYARGFDFEIFSMQALKEAYEQATLPMDLEHVTPYIHQNRSGKTVFKHYTQPVDKSQYRITLDTADDFKLIEILIDKYDAARLSQPEIEAILDAHPELVAINAHIEQKKLGQ